MNFVEYLTKEKQTDLIDWDPFTKKDDYNYQNEFRISFVSDASEAVTLDLKCLLRNIAVPINDTDLCKIHFERESLVYPVY